MSKWKEIRCGFVDKEENVVCIDAWKTFNDMEEGRVIAKVDLTTKNVTYLDEAAKTDEYAQKVINEAIASIEKEDAFVILKAINIEWDFDEETETVDLPNEIEIPKGMTDEDEISDYISDLTGFCHKGFELINAVEKLERSALDEEVPKVENNELIRNATFTSVWDDGAEVTTNCKVNLATREVFDIEKNDSDEIEGLNELEREYITIDGEEYDVYNSAIYDNSNNYEDFWYGEEVKYPHLSLSEDYKYLKESLSEAALNELEGILDAYDKDRIDFELKKDPSGFTAEFSLIINDMDYQETGLEAVALKWSEAMESTEHLVDCFTDAFEYNSYRFTVDYSENGEHKSFPIGVSSKEKPDSKWLAQEISNYFSSHYKGGLDAALDSVEGIDVLIENAKGEYVDSDEVYGDDLEALFEHLKKDKPRLDEVISAAEQKQDNIIDKKAPVVEQER